MALVLADRVQVTTSTTGTGTLTLGSAVTGFQDFAVIGDDNTTYYTITDNNNWEVGIGTYTDSGTTLSRDTVLESSNAGAKVNFGAGTKFVFCTYPAEKSVDIETAQTLTNKTINGSNNTITNVSLTAGVTGVLPIANGGTGETTRQAAIDALAGAVTSGQYLRGNGTDVVMANIVAGDVPTLNQNTTGNAASATVLQTARLLNGVSFNGSANITVPTNLGITAGTTAGPIVTSSSGTNATLPTATASASGVVTTGAQTWAGVKTFNSTITGSISGNSGTATALQTARTINGTSFNGSANITTANWGTARTLWGQSVDGSANITAPLRPAAGSVSAPAFSTSADTNTGMFFPAADTIAFSEGGVERMRIDSSGNLRFNSGYGSVATAYGCRAWVNFNGTGTVAIRASGNVSSITDNGTGDYTVNFATAMADADYSVNATGRISGSNGLIVNNENSSPQTTSATSVLSINAANNLADAIMVSVVIFR
jgi:hypothetical protein